MPKLPLILAVALLLGACTTGKVFVKAYDGAEEAPKQVALVKPASAVEILAIDGDFARRFNPIQSFGNLDYEIALKPGAHSITVAYGNGVAYSVQRQTRTFHAEAGRRYLIKSNKSFSTWNPQIVDVTEKDECWTVLAEVLARDCP